jgi:hypothetical protein
MFVGRETYAAEIQDSLVKTVYAHNANVNQAIERLLRHKSEFLVFKKSHREEGIRGREAEKYTANLEPIFETLKSFGVAFNQSKLEDVLGQMSEVNSYFPKYFTNMYEKSVLRTMSWNNLLNLFLTFIIEAINSTSYDFIAYPLPSDFKLAKEKIIHLQSKYPKLKTELYSISMQLSVPGIALNPQFKAHLTEVSKGLEKLEVYSMGMIGLMKDLKEMGFNNLSDLSAQFREGMAQVEESKALVKKLRDLSSLMEKANEKINALGNKQE